MNVTLTLSTPERPEVHARAMSGVTSVRYTADNDAIDAPLPGLQLRFKDRVERFDLTTVLDVLIS